MYYLIYKITNKITGKYYVGSHKTKNINDDYMGSGKYLNHAKVKYGIENFEKEILFVYDTAEEMYAKEREIVNEDFLATENTYNLKIGGKGGWDLVNAEGKNKNFDWRQYQKTEKFRESQNKGYLNSIGKSGFVRPKINPMAFLNKSHSEETKQIIGEKNSVHQSGSGNSQFGTTWITDGAESKKISKTDVIPDGWKKGRIIKK